jgi:small subunit ribosomal protein S17
MSEEDTIPTEAAEAAAPAPEAAAGPAKRPLRKTRTGTVISNKMDKTIVVEYVARVPHPRFKKIVKRSKKFYAHDEKGEAKIGDKVRISETRPLSKLKRWRLIEVLAH